MSAFTWCLLIKRPPVEDVPLPKPRKASLLKAKDISVIYIDLLASVVPNATQFVKVCTLTDVVIPVYESVQDHSLLQVFECERFTKV